jgi:cell wall-associated NlpC family hydrolase
MNALVQQARKYIGVPWKHRGRTRRGLDCGGLPAIVYADLGDPRPDLSRYGRDPFKDGLMRALEDALGAPVWSGSKGQCPRSVLQPGQVVAIAPDKLPRHVAIIGDDEIHGLSIIHADGTPGIKRVIEQGMEPDTLGKIVAVYQRPVQ